MWQSRQRLPDDDEGLAVMEGLASNYRDTLARRFSEPQKLHDRIADLLRFIWSEIEKARGEQLVLQEMTLYVLRYPHAEHLAAHALRCALRAGVDRGDAAERSLLYRC